MRTSELDGNTEAVTNDSGDRVTPAIVAFSNGEKSVGLAAKSEMARNPSGTICHLKGLLGSTASEEFEQLVRESPCKIVAEGDEVHYEVSSAEDQRSVRHSRSQVLVYLFRKMFEVAESQGSDEFPTVVTVPPEFSEDQRKLVAEAANKAGFQVLRLVNEPTAAVLAYHMGTAPSPTPCNLGIVDLRGLFLLFFAPQMPRADIVRIAKRATPKTPATSDPIRRQREGT
ncbi:hypothetical protein HPB48_003405 [Haemaphysalis longicornis]|uniref:Uncharacterized protein n=1 Tax=Haemaphysalis longicornis TaxID=44386 RepID=A0A9J6FN00_HAELO|nr:hypothetical protein HPB48_003405 [Haemaphysalis longicornis]